MVWPMVHEEKEGDCKQGSTIIKCGRLVLHSGFYPPTKFVKKFLKNSIHKLLALCLLL